MSHSDIDFPARTTDVALRLSSSHSSGTTESPNSGSVQSQRSLVLNVVIFHRAQFVPEKESSGDGDANADADE